MLIYVVKAGFLRRIRSLAIDDAAIVDLYLERDETAISHTAEKYGRAIRHLAHNVVGDEETSMECENDTYLKTWNSIPPHEPRTYFFPFLGKIVRAVAINRLKSNVALKRNAVVVELSEELENVVCSPDNIENEMDGQLLSKLVSDFLRGVSPEKRQVFVRRYWHMQSLAEISEALGISEGKIKSILFRLRGSLKEYLEKEGYHI